MSSLLFIASSLPLPKFIMIQLFSLFVSRSSIVFPSISFQAGIIPIFYRLFATDLLLTLPTTCSLPPSRMDCLMDMTAIRRFQSPVQQMASLNGGLQDNRLTTDFGRLARR